MSVKKNTDSNGKTFNTLIGSCKSQELSPAFQTAEGCMGQCLRALVAQQRGYLDNLSVGTTCGVEVNQQGECV